MQVKQQTIVTATDEMARPDRIAPVTDFVLMVSVTMGRSLDVIVTTLESAQIIPHELGRRDPHQRMILILKKIYVALCQFSRRPSGPGSEQTS